MREKERKEDRQENLDNKTRINRTAGNRIIKKKINQ